MRALNEAVAVFQKRGPPVCTEHTTLTTLTSAASFMSYQPVPLPVDQKLLTLLHFNLVRALTHNVLLLGCDPDALHMDLNSAFAPPCDLPSANPQGVVLQKLPQSLRPTALQRMVPHHPEVDVYPFPAFRDNLILAGESIDDLELCMDVLYGVEGGGQVGERRDGDGDETRMVRVREVVYRDEAKVGRERRLVDGSCRKLVPLRAGGRTGLIVWADPWLQESWEVDEVFAWKYRRLLRGCDVLLRSTNHWRARRGEKRLVLDDWE